MNNRTVTMTEDEAKLAKEALDFLVNKCSLPAMTPVEAFALSRKISVLSKVPAILSQYIFEVKSIQQGEETEPAKKKK